MDELGLPGCAVKIPPKLPSTTAKNRDNWQLWDESTAILLITSSDSCPVKHTPDPEGNRIMEQADGVDLPTAKQIYMNVRRIGRATGQYTRYVTDMAAVIVLPVSSQQCWASCDPLALHTYPQSIFPSCNLTPFPIA